MFQRHREQFMQAMGGGLAILVAAPVYVRTADQEHTFRQDSDLYYLTGFREPETILVLAPGQAEHRVIMFVRPRDPERETWNGRRAGVEGVVRDYGADVAYPIEQFDEILPRYMDGQAKLYYHLGRDAAMDTRIIGHLASYRASAKIRQGIQGPMTVIDPAALLHEARLRKDEDELTLLRRAAELSARAHREAMQATRPGMYEYELEALLNHRFRHEGAWGPSYGSIVGGGENGCILHYQENASVLREGELLLIDAGAEVDGYAGDITRTFPVAGRFSPAQRELYDLVLAAQLAALAEVRPGSSFQAVHDAAVRVLAAGMVRLGLLTGEVDELIRTEAYKRFYMHRTSHWLGLDVHDVGQYQVGGTWRPLEPGMVLTVEPGIYVTPAPDVAEQYWNIGIRIEDDVLVTASGHEVLTAGVPKDPAEIEQLMAGALAARA